MRVCGKRIDTQEVVTLTLVEGKIATIEPGDRNAVIGDPNVWLAPGFCDTQINGYGGHDFNQAVWGHSGRMEPAIYALRALLAKAGTALFCPTITTNSPEAMLGSIAAISHALDSDPQLAKSVPGLHIEGPYIAPEDGPRGAHPLEHVRNPDWNEFLTWQEAAQGRIKICTLAPERPGALGFIEKLTQAGVVAGIGHTAAEPEAIRDAVKAGARLSIHLGNGAHSMLRRHPNYIWEQLAEDSLYASLITDGHHLPAGVVKVMARVKGPDRLVLVSDAVSLGGLAPGLYHEGRYEVLPSGKITLAGTPYLAGAGHLLDTCIANALRFTDFSPADVLRSVNTNPAMLLGLGGCKGQIAPGFDADLTLFRLPETGPLEIVATLCAAQSVFNA